MRRGLVLQARRQMSLARYPFLKQLGLKEENPGVFDGAW
jgi:hypothetical protein